MTLASYEPVRKLAASDGVRSFDCGEQALNVFLQRFAWVNQQSHSAQTYVTCKASEMAGFYSLTVGSVEPVAQRRKMPLAEGLAGIRRRRVIAAA